MALVANSFRARYRFVRVLSQREFSAMAGRRRLPLRPDTDHADRDVNASNRWTYAVIDVRAVT